MTSWLRYEHFFSCSLQSTAKWYYIGYDKHHLDPAESCQIVLKQPAQVHKSHRFCLGCHDTCNWTCSRSLFRSRKIPQILNRSNLYTICRQLRRDASNVGTGFSHPCHSSTPDNKSWSPHVQIHQTSRYVRGANIKQKPTTYIRNCRLENTNTSWITKCHQHHPHPAIGSTW